MTWLWLIVSMTASVTQGALMNRVSKTDGRTASDLYFFNLLCNAAAMVCVLLYGGLPSVSPYTLLLGVAFGAATNLGGLYKILALKCGPMCYTLLIISSSMLIPAFSGAILWDEPLSALKIAGAACMMVSLALSVEYRRGEKTSLRWFLLSMTSFLFCGSVGVMQKIFGHSAYAEEQGGFLCAAFLTATAFAAGNFAWSRCVRRVPCGAKLRASVLPALATGVTIAAANIINLYLANAMPSIIFFPLFNGGVLLLSTAVAFVFFRERLKPVQTAGFCIGIAAVAILCLG